MSETTNNYKFMGFFELLTLIFVVAKLTGYIAWSWWWVFSPVIAHAIIVIILIVVIFCGALVYTLIKGD
jgi:hypothetical protein